MLHWIRSNWVPLATIFGTLAFVAIVVTAKTSWDPLAIFTGTLTVSTIGLWYTTHRLGERAHKGLRALERAQVHIAIVGHNMDDVIRITDPLSEGFPQVTFRIKNHGRTPAFIVRADHSFTVDKSEVGDPQRERLDIRDHVLGNNDDREHTDQAVLTERAMRDAIAAGDLTLRFHVRIIYEDIWGDRWGEGLEATYNIKTKRFALKRDRTIPLRS